MLLVVIWAFTGLGFAVTTVAKLWARVNVMAALSYMLVVSDG